MQPLVETPNDRTGYDQRYANDAYTVYVKRYTARRDMGPMTRLSVQPASGPRGHLWADFQAIKNQLCGAECEGFELYPVESELRDIEDMYHIWVFPAGQEFGFAMVGKKGFRRRCHA